MRQPIHAALAIGALCFGVAQADMPDPDTWDVVLDQAKGQTVYFHAWAGEPRINDYIKWASAQLAEKHDVRLNHVKVSDTASVVSKVVTEKAAGRDTDGAVDLIWINGENFAAMKEQGLLLPDGWADRLPNYRFVDVADKPSIEVDFTVPVDGLQAPWGMAKLVFFHDTASLDDPPRSAAELGRWITDNPGRFTYPQPPNFIGTSFLKQLLIDLAPDPSVLQEPAHETDAAAAIAPMFAWLEAAKPNLWRAGRTYPQDYGAMRRLLADNEVDISFAFNPSDASSAIASNELPGTIRSFVFPTGTLGNTHFLAIPYNASAKAGAMVAANFLMSPEAQAHKQNVDVWGDPTVLAMDKLSADDRARFEALDLGVATLKPEELGPVLIEPHPSWVSLIEEEWSRRFGVNQ